MHDSSSRRPGSDNLRRRISRRSLNGQQELEATTEPRTRPDEAGEADARRWVLAAVAIGALLAAYGSVAFAMGRLYERDRQVDHMMEAARRAAQEVVHERRN